jgi:hypothetical protein
MAAVGMLLAAGSQTWAALAAWATFVLIAASVYYARRQIQEANRPFVAVQYETRFVTLLLVIENFGSTVARGIWLQF